MHRCRYRLWQLRATGAHAAGCRRADARRAGGDRYMTCTTCPYCGVGCGVIATFNNQIPGKVSIQGDPEHPANQGRLCVKGSALADTLGLEGRLLQPLLRDGDGNPQPASWDQALDRVASGM